MKLFYYIYLLEFIKNTYGGCFGTFPLTCINRIEDEEASEKLKYIRKRYEEADMKITGEAIHVTGQKITHENDEEWHITFHYIDNTPSDIIQRCFFVLVNKQGECESISMACNTGLPRTPRPLFKRKKIIICDNGEQPAQVHVVEEIIEVEQKELLDEEQEEGVTESKEFEDKNESEIAEKSK